MVYDKLLNDEKPRTEIAKVKKKATSNGPELSIFPVEAKYKKSNKKITEQASSIL
jgi:hypothetical protein